MATHTHGKATMTRRAQRREFFFTLLLLAVVFAATLATAARGDEPDQAEAQRRRRVWDASWQPVAAHYVPHGGGFVFFARTGDTPSSLGLTAEQHARATAREFELMDDKGRVKKQAHTKPADECNAWVRALPEPVPGAYGFIHSGRVEEVNAAGGVVVLRGVWLIDAEAMHRAREDEMQELRRKTWTRIEDAIRDRDRGRANIADQRFEGQEYVEFRYENRVDLARRQQHFAERTWRLEGVSTRGAVVGQRWPSGTTGVQVAVVRVGGGQVVAIGAEALRKGVTQEQFQQVLAQRGHTADQFIDAALKAKQAAPRDWVVPVLRAIEPQAAGL